MIYNLFNNNIKKEFIYDLSNIIIKKDSPILFLCVGSNKFASDSLGALVGELLKNYYKINEIVIGNMTHPIIAKNLNRTLNLIKEKYSNYRVIVVDASVGTLNNLYNVKLNNFGLQIAHQVNQNLIGDISISCTTYIKGLNGLIITPMEQKRNIFFVANCIAHSIKTALDLCKNIAKISI
jgi:putative sporulation protein YyaC